MAVGLLMRFSKPLIEAVLLKRTKPHCAEVAINKKKKISVFCPNVLPMKNCDVMGSRIWLSESKNLNNKYTWELSEVDGGYLVDVNSYRIINLVLEALENKIIFELNNYNILDIEHELADLVLINESGRKCFVCINHISYADELNRGFFPEIKTNCDKEQITKLSRLVESGNKAIILYCVQNSGADKLFLAPQVDSDYANYIVQAKKLGVEILAYKSDVTLDGVRLVESCPIFYTKNLVT